MVYGNLLSMLQLQICMWGCGHRSSVTVKPIKSSSTKGCDQQWGVTSSAVIIKLGGNILSFIYVRLIGINVVSRRHI